MRIFIDMDGVIVDFEAMMTERGLTGDELKKVPGAYLSMEPIPGAVVAVKTIIAMGYEVWIATKPPTGVPGAYADKVNWILDYLPELKRNIILTHDKGLLGGETDLLIDDRPHKANCDKFQGAFIKFWDGESGRKWPEILDLLRDYKEYVEADLYDRTPDPLAGCWQ